MACNRRNMVLFGLRDIPAEMRLMYQESVENGGGGWRAIGEKIGVSGAYARMLATGERKLTPTLAARWLGDVDLEVTKRVEVCPSCLKLGKREAHIAGDCGGREVIAVVTLAPGEVVRRNGHERNGPPDERATLHVPKDTRDAINARRRVKGLTQAELIEKALIAYDLLEER